MAIFRAYAKVLEPDDPSMRIYEAGLRRMPRAAGTRARATCCGGRAAVYETTAPLPPEFRDDIREVAELTSDAGAARDRGSDRGARVP